LTINHKWDDELLDEIALKTMIICDQACGIKLEIYDDEDGTTICEPRGFKLEWNVSYG